MSYTVRYTGTREARRMKAFADAMDWLGTPEQQEKVLSAVQAILRDSTLTGRQKVNCARLGLSFQGIHGAPAWAIMHTLIRCK
jgi:hypothetical protein